jgi:hypothetical protein
MTNWEEVDGVFAFLKVARSGLQLPLSGDGDTWTRLKTFRKVTAQSPSAGRLVEAHTDAAAVLSEAGRDVPGQTALAVWASTSASQVAASESEGGLLLSGSMRFCGGAGVVDSSVVAVRGAQGEQLVLIPLRQRGVSIDLSSWQTTAFAEAGIGRVSFNQVFVPEEDVIGAPGFYSSRSGFWWGAVGVAACWVGLVDRLNVLWVARSRRRDPLAEVIEGKRLSLLWSIDALLRHAAVIADARDGSNARSVALCVRDSIATASTSFLQLVEAAAGPGPLAFEPEWARTCTELRLALGQSHGDRDLQALGADVLLH